MSISTEISRIQTASSIIKNKFSNFGLSKDPDDGSGKVSVNDGLDVQARAINLINKNSLTTTVTSPSDSVPIPEGYYDGSGSVNVAVAVNYYYTGEETPGASIGNDGDLYLVI